MINKIEEIKSQIKGDSFMENQKICDINDHGISLYIPPTIDKIKSLEFI